MRALTLATLCAVFLAVTPSCAYKNYYTFSGTRKLVESDAPAVTRVFFTPFILLFEGLWAPITAYMDTSGYAEGKDHVYLSYIGMQTLMSARIDMGYKFVGSIMVIPIDTAWFPLAGTVDTIYALSSDTTPDADPVVERGDEN